MRFPRPAILASIILAGPALAQTTLVEEIFTYADGLVDTLNGGTGWSNAWQTGNSVAAQNRFEVISNEAIYLGGGVGTYTEQNRTFTTPVTSSATDIITANFTLIRPETQGGRGIGIYLTNAGANQFFIGKKVNGNVGLHDGMGIPATTFASFANSGSPEQITATITYNGNDTSIVLSDSNETLAAHKITGTFTFDGISLAGYNGATLTNGIDEISVVSTPAPDPALQVASLVEFTGNGTATAYSIPIFNAGPTQTLNISGVTATGFDSGDVSGISFPTTLAPLTAGTIDFTFTPSFGGAIYFFDLEIASDDASATSPRIVGVEVDVADPIIEVDVTSIDFGALANNPGPQTATVNVTNAGGSQPLTINSTNITGSAGFTVTSAPTSIAAGATEPIEITFDPGTQPGAFSASLTIASNDFNFTEPVISLTASTAYGGTFLADYGFGTGTSLDLTSADTTIGSVAGDLVETDLGSRTEFGLRVINGTANATTPALIGGNSLGWSRRESPNFGLDLTVDAPSEALTFTLTPVGGNTVEFGTDGWMTLELGAYSEIGGPTSYDFVLKVDDGSSPFTVGPVSGPSIPGAGEDKVTLTFDLRGLGSVTTPATFTLMPQRTGNGNGVLGQAGGYIDNILLTGTEIAPATPVLAVTSPAVFTNEGLTENFSIPTLNTGAGELTITSVTTDGSGAASTISAITFDAYLAGTGGTGSIDFTFTPDAGPGLYTTNLTVISNDPGSPTTIALEITVRDPEILVTDSVLSFGILSHNPGVQVLNLPVTNDGESADLVVSGTTLTGSTTFTVTSLPGPIAPGATGDIEITLTPGSAEGRLTAAITIQSNDFDGTEPEVTLTGFVDPVGTVVSRFDFDPNNVAGSAVDLDGSPMTDWTTGDLTDLATGTGALGGGNQGNANRAIATAATGNYLRFSSNREGDAQTPVANGGNDESTWTTFSVTPDVGGGEINFTGGTAVIDTYASTSLGTNTAADWTLYYSTDGGTTWLSLGTSAGAATNGALTAPLGLSWDLTPIGNATTAVDFILDPVSTGGTNGNVSQRGVGFDNLVLSAGSVVPGSAGFSSWATDNSITANPNGDTDKDGIEEIVEYALGLDPNVPNGAPGTLVGNLLSFTKGAEAVANGDLNYLIETSTDLGDTDPWTAVPIPPEDNNATTISYTLPTGQAKIFARLRVAEMIDPS